MIIKKLSIKDFGKHEKIELKDIGNIFGIIGKNGAGKSTILKAIEFIFTGDLPEQNGTWIRDGAKKAIVACVFKHQGKEGMIVRELGKTTSKRSLTWAGSETISKATEVDKALNDILGADKKALANAVFVSQGEINNILFAGDVN